MSKIYAHSTRVRILKLFEEGMGYAELSDAYDIPRATIYGWVKRHRETGDTAPGPKFAMKPYKCTPREKYRKEALRLLAEDKTLGEIAEMWGVCKYTVSQIVTEALNERIRI